MCGTYPCCWWCIRHPLPLGSGFWETSKVRSWAAHYKGVTCLAFDESGLMLFSGAQDTLACVWLLAELLDVAVDSSDPSYHRPQPLYSWSDHTLPVTSIHVGSGEATAIVATCSLDRTAKIHRLSDGCLLMSVVLPTGLNCVVMDAGEHAMYCGGSDGKVYEVPLVRPQHNNDTSFKASTSTSVNAGASTAPYGFTCMEGHSRAVNALSMSVDGENLVSGSDDGTACVWDLRSRQAVQVIQGSGKHPITGVIVLRLPEHMAAAGSGGAGSFQQGGRQGPKRMQPLAPLSKYPGVSGSLQPWEGPAMIIDGRQPFEGLALQCGLWGAVTDASCSSISGSHRAVGGWSESGWPILEPREWSKRDETSSIATASGIQEDKKSFDASDSKKRQQPSGSTGPSGRVTSNKMSDSGNSDEILRLKEELRETQALAKKWKDLHAKLYEVAVKETLE
ncbi:hypothetical protein CEUSTIGMA_g13686.t1 [Chlamydomonas eustigma]|uniref:Uncharacterized protein n=1 Tax=Chlamydomonas eustigma TaxID=1157962 RepID=A0A250XT78_9CHLO|nr:hypothetical protein CEUSTIGMA_g13686.t1 [Chlamydomonas eustigma]|eukprot:GAX86274.1 hypothetical protein CEUSTIGMA_g13686.t1 [Chlamydomonas eustigma]